MTTPKQAADDWIRAKADARSAENRQREAERVLGEVPPHGGTVIVLGSTGAVMVESRGSYGSYHVTVSAVEVVR